MSGGPASGGGARGLFDALLGGGGADARTAIVFIRGGIESRFTRAGLAAAAAEVGRRVAEALAGQPRGTIVAVLARSQEEQVLHVLACLAAGRIPAVLTPRTPKLDLGWYLHSTLDVLHRIRPALVLTDLAEELFEAAGPSRMPPLARLRTAERLGGEAKDPTIVPEGTAFVQFSSGTTGAKKGVAVGLPAVLSQLAGYGEALRLRATGRIEADRVMDGDAVVSWLPLYHDMGFVTAFLLPLWSGVFVSMLDPLEWVADPGSYLREVSRRGATLGWHPNFAFAHMARSARGVEDAALGSLRLLANCSEPVTHDAQERFRTRFAARGLRPDVFAGCYAMAETTFAVTHGHPGEEVRDRAGPANGGPLRTRLPLVSVGRALPSVEIRAVSEGGTPCGEGIVGELWIRAPFLSGGYVQNPGATSASFRDGFYRTGDLGYRRGRDWYVLGRQGDMMILAGHNVFPEDVERIVGAAPGIKPGRTVAFAEFDEGLQTERLVVLAEPARDGTLPDLVAIRTRLQAELQVAARIEMVPPGWLVKSSSGKPARRASAEKRARAGEAEGGLSRTV